MTYTGVYRPRAGTVLPEKPVTASEAPPTWACSLFTVLLDENNLLYGRNFDWQFSPALLLFTDPPDGYASVSMVDLAYFGFNETTTKDIVDFPIEERTSLLDAPYLPFDGMNEHGLVIGMAAVSSGNMEPDETKKPSARLASSARCWTMPAQWTKQLKSMQGYNIDFEGGPPIHYLMADANGKSVLVEYYNGEMHVHRK